MSLLMFGDLSRVYVSKACSIVCAPKISAWLDHMFKDCNMLLHSGARALEHVGMNACCTRHVHCCTNAALGMHVCCITCASLQHVLTLSKSLLPVKTAQNYGLGGPGVALLSKLLKSRRGRSPQRAGIGVCGLAVVVVLSRWLRTAGGSKTGDRGHRTPRDPSTRYTGCHPR